MKAARTRWRIENETFKTLTSETGGDNLEHNYGHGKQYLASVMAHLCMLVFLMEQVEQLCCPHFRKALEQQVHTKYMWEEMRLIFSRVILNDWETFSRLLSDNDWAMDGELLLAEPEPEDMSRKCSWSNNFNVNWKSIKEAGGKGPSMPLAYPLGRTYHQKKEKLAGITDTKKCSFGLFFVNENTKKQQINVLEGHPARQITV